jgi:hypothetical protein
LQFRYRASEESEAALGASRPQLQGAKCFAFIILLSSLIPISNINSVSFFAFIFSVVLCRSLLQVDEPM